MSLEVLIMTPDKVFLKEKAEEIILPTNTGQMGVLKNHAPLVTALEVGVILLRSNTSWSNVAVMGGFGIVKDNVVTVLVNGAESAESIDKAQAEKLFLEAQKRLSQPSLSGKEKVEANFAFKRARARFQAARS